MKRIQYHQYGGPHLMRLEDFELAMPNKGEVAVRVKFAAINPIDWKLRAGSMKIVTGKTFPRAMGMDISGTVIAIGPGVARFKIGDPVFGLARFKESGALGQAVVTKEIFLAKKPETVSFEDAACLGTPGATAWNGLVDKAELKAGERVFINGCTGGVGEAAVQIALMRGATVSGSCSAGAMERARSLGVQTVFDYRTTDLSTIRERFDVVYDTAATMPIAVGTGLLREKGRFLDINPTPAKFVRAMFNRRLKVVVCTPRADILDNLARAAKDGKIRLPIAEIVPLTEAIQLITALEAGRRLGGKALVGMD
ncbi:NADPH:quinone reductase-like Zn-dependent oxidoreductase [Rhizobium sp. BK226]|jgi:NADPH:quinone reductase-like Zn-dependent oxidoreductase|uniref:NAD(P)-dependent alcohol dehydrogenase n=1 Tax=Rhizobium TaxID=379 RepID=UPI000412306D|nr:MULTISPECIES: NAD(P)-dependent alcohol dehydrogenase [Rhizobium]KZS51543.1 alcohol dehydrogenase [Rhizobium anhuiense bv. trifolii]MBB3299502.1 NADPH:quinone reductase-like Zn-dependent oxidoreductase [Rhizobium sp. BK112]MBB3369230.1 NADPH:quinone reductase-like Zn-dependent oxidoreductase [Rhizobium sp. BK077]MBB4113720.1 NADPH:quinone reductase-like Zn-dependent oxidoreductase [Rhizobium sp. BK226]MBB4179392.1 NADPH:quinone reductase-like Zn-dependent oxidoreductase [Rhizobium sp. BK109]